MPDFDVIVAGAGPAGLAAALSLAAGGRRVLLLEDDIAAGRGSLLRGRFEFDAAGGSWCVPALTAQRGQALWQRLNAEHELGLTCWEAPDGGRLLARLSGGESLDITLPRGRRELAELLARQAPAKGWKQFWSLAEECAAAMNFLAEGGEPSRAESRYPGLRRAGVYELAPVCQSLRLGQRGQSLLSALTPLVCGSSGPVLFAHFAAQLLQYAAGGLSRPGEGWYALFAALLKRFRDIGGQARLGCPITRLELTETQVSLATLSGPVSAAALVWARDESELWNGELAPGLRDRFPCSAALRAARRGSLLFSCRLGLACPGRELGLSSVLSLQSEAGEGALLAQVSPGPDEDSCCLLLTLPLSEDWWGRVSGAEAAARSQRLAGSCLQRAGAALGRELDPYIEEMEVRTEPEPMLSAGPLQADSPLSRLLLPEYTGPVLHLCGPGACLGWGVDAQLAAGEGTAQLLLKKGEKLWPSA